MSCEVSPLTTNQTVELNQTASQVSINADSKPARPRFTRRQKIILGLMGAGLFIEALVFCTLVSQSAIAYVQSLPPEATRTPTLDDVFLSVPNPDCLPADMSRRDEYYLNPRQIIGVGGRTISLNIKGAGVPEARVNWYDYQPSPGGGFTKVQVRHNQPLTDTLTWGEEVVIENLMETITHTISFSQQSGILARTSTCAGIR